MKLLFTIFATVTFFTACKKELPVRTYLSTPSDTLMPPATDTMNMPDTSSNQQYSYLALGDSYTIGQSVDSSARFPVQTVQQLKELSLNFDSPEIIARTGWTTSNLLSELVATPPSKTTYDVVSLLIGVNNQYQGGSQEDYRREFVTLLSKAITYSGNRPKRVFVLSIPDYSVTPFASSSNKERIAKEIDSFNAINLYEAQLAGVKYLEITSSTREAATDASLIATDQLHPSGREYYKWAKRLAPMIKAVL